MTPTNPKPFPPTRHTFFILFKVLSFCTAIHFSFYSLLRFSRFAQVVHTLRTSYTVIMSDPMEVLDSQPSLPRFRRERDGFNRTDVVNAFQDAFQVIGGTTRLALWANANPDKFYQLYSKLLPSQSQQFVESTQRVIMHALPPSALDHHPGYAPPVVEVLPSQEEPVKR